MLFFKQIMDEKFEKEAFRKFYKKECHICSTTVKVIAELEEKGVVSSGVFEALDISEKAYEDLREGENCNPELVRKLCAYLGFLEPGLFENCPRLS